MAQSRHAFNFLFGNEIDTHQQSRLTRDRNLFGFFYIEFTAVVTKDLYRVATHVDCSATPDCTVGWTLDGRKVSATFLYGTEHDHPVFLVSRPDIPQPGAFAHFHWLGTRRPRASPRTAICCISPRWISSASFTTKPRARREPRLVGATAV